MTAATQYTAQLPALAGTSSNLGALANQSSSTLSDMAKLVVDVTAFASIGSTVGAANSSLQSMLTQALGAVSRLLADIGQQVGASAQRYAAADQSVAQSLGTGAQSSTGTTATTSAISTDGDAFIDHFAANHSQGASGSEVREFQRELQQLGYHPGTADGQWGPSTQQAYQDYQAHHHYQAGAGSGTQH